MTAAAARRAASSRVVTRALIAKKGAALVAIKRRWRLAEAGPHSW